MKLDPPRNPNYAAMVVRVKSLVPLPNADRLLGLPLFGMQAIVGLNTQVGDLGVLFPTECQLSEEYCRENNLFRHAELNADKKTVGYLEDNRRVKAIKLRGNVSNALFMPLDSLAFAGTADLQEGDTFDTLNGHEICCKYEVLTRVSGGANRQLKKQDQRVDARMFPEQSDVHHWLREVEHVAADAMCVITQKLHGCNIRIGNVLVKRKLSLVERVSKFFGARVQDQEYSMVYGSHHAIKDANNPAQQHFYDYDVWTDAGKRFDGLIPQGYVVYGELVGWTPEGKAIQAHYTYDQMPKTNEVYVYRVTFVNQQGVVVDLSWDAVKEFCQTIGAKHVPELDRKAARDIDLSWWMDKTFSKIDWLKMCHPVPLSDDSPCDEGVCIRVEGMNPTIYKAKSPLFLGHETSMLDQGNAGEEA